MNKQLDRKTMNIMPCQFDEGYGARAKMGLIVLQSDQTIEQEFSVILQNITDKQSEIALYHSRIANADEVTPETLKAMALEMPIAAQLLNQDFNYDVIGYACTSGATMIGEDRVEQIIQQIHPQAKVTNPITSCKAALHKLAVKNVALLTPYAPEVTNAMQENLQTAGFHIATVDSFYQTQDSAVARITAESILKAILQIGKNDAIDAVFVSCTSLRVLDIIAQAESTLGKPVTSSNQALIWHMLRLADIDNHLPNKGLLFKN